MLSQLRSRLTYANVVASIALFLALGGGAYALTIPANSVGTKQLKNRAVTSKKLRSRAVTTTKIRNGAVTRAKIRNGAVTRAKIRNDAVNSAKVADASLLAKDFAPGQLPAGPAGPTGPAGASALNPVPSGKTIHGVVGGDFHAFDSSASDFGTDVTLPIPAANALSDADVFVNVSGWQNAGGQTAPTTSDTSPGCTGTPAAPTAPAGKVCIYVSGADHAFNLAGFSVLFGTGASPYGFKLKWDASTAGDTFVDATWAYTAP